MICSYHWEKKSWNTNDFWPGFLGHHIRWIYHWTTFRSDLWVSPSLFPPTSLPTPSWPLLRYVIFIIVQSKVEECSTEGVQCTVFFKFLFVLTIYIIIKFSRYVFHQKEKLKSHFFGSVFFFFLPFLLHSNLFKEYETDGWD